MLCSFALIIYFVVVSYSLLHLGSLISIWTGWLGFEKELVRLFTDSSPVGSWKGNTQKNTRPRFFIENQGTHAERVWIFHRFLCIICFLINNYID